MADSAEEIEELPVEEDGGALADDPPASETTEARKRICAKLHADVAKICENEGMRLSNAIFDSFSNFHHTKTESSFVDVI